MLTRLLATSLLALSSCALAADKPVPADNPVPTERLAQELVGTWKMVSARYGDRDSTLPKRMVVIKHVTPTHMTWFRADPETQSVVDMASGKWSLKGDQYADFPEFGLGTAFPVVKDGTHRFTCKIVGDCWYHTGALENGLKIEEVWKRKALQEKTNDNELTK